MPGPGVHKGYPIEWPTLCLCHTQVWILTKMTQIICSLYDKGWSSTIALTILPKKRRWESGRDYPMPLALQKIS